MTIMELMDNLADFIRPVVADYSTQQPSGQREIQVYAGYPPIRDKAREQASFVYVLVVSAEDKEDMTFSTAKVEIGVSVYDANGADGSRSLFNLLEHLRQHLLKHRLVASKHRLELPLKINIPDEQPYPQWEGALTATYTIGQPYEEDINYDNIQETKAGK